MRLLNRWVVEHPPPLPPPIPGPDACTGDAAVPGQGNTRRDCWGGVGDTMVKHGIPRHGSAPEMLVSDTPGGEAGPPAVRVKQWERALLNPWVAFQQSFFRRLILFDPLAASWLTVFLAVRLARPGVCPDMPDPAI